MLLGERSLRRRAIRLDAHELRCDLQQLRLGIAARALELANPCVLHHDVTPQLAVLAAQASGLGFRLVGRHGHGAAWPVATACARRRVAARARSWACGSSVQGFCASRSCDHLAMKRARLRSLANVRSATRMLPPLAWTTTRDAGAQRTT